MTDQPDQLASDASVGSGDLRPGPPRTSISGVLPAHPSDVQLRAVAGVIVRDHLGRVLLMRRAGEGSWCLTGGGIEPGETWSDAAVRECLEETGWSIRIDGIFGAYSDPETQMHVYPSGHRYHFAGVVLLGTAQEQVGETDGEADALCWVSDHHGLPQPLFAPDVPVIEDYFGGRTPPVLG